MSRTMPLPVTRTRTHPSVRFYSPRGRPGLLADMANAIGVDGVLATAAGEERAPSRVPLCDASIFANCAIIAMIFLSSRDRPALCCTAFLPPLRLRTTDDGDPTAGVVSPCEQQHWSHGRAQCDWVECIAAVLAPIRAVAQVGWGKCACVALIGPGDADECTDSMARVRVCVRSFVRACARAFDRACVGMLHLCVRRRTCGRRAMRRPRC
jgi:hypothetical protein